MIIDNYNTLSPFDSLIFQLCQQLISVLERGAQILQQRNVLCAFHSVFLTLTFVVRIV